MPDRSVVVLGMHRSGTLAMISAVNLLGPSLCREGDLYVGDDNATGHSESVHRLIRRKASDAVREHIGAFDWACCRLEYVLGRRYASLVDGIAAACRVAARKSAVAR